MHRIRSKALLLALAAATLACNLLPAAGTTAPTVGRPDTAALLSSLGGTPCPGSSFICVTLELPLDQAAPSDERKLAVTFAVLPATGERKGMFVTVVGGPGGSGLAVAEGYSAAFDPRLREQFDIVFFDQRGVGASGGLQCPAAAAAYYQTGMDPLTARGEAAMGEAARLFALACTAEMGGGELLNYLATEQAVADLEAFRQALGEERFWLYGESYGTQFAQTYAAAYPQHLAGLILDGPVDLTLSGSDFLAEQAQAFSRVLQMTLEDCNRDPSCAADMGGNAVSAYETLAARLRSNPVDFSFPLPSGGTAERTFSFTGLETAAAGSLYAEGSRMIFLRALAAADQRDDLVPLARILYEELALDPTTLAALPDPTFSDAVYYGVECSDYGYGTPAEYLLAGDTLDASLPYLATVFYSDLPCTYWPGAQPATGRPGPLRAEGIPTLVLVGTADPATPLPNAQRIVSRLADGYLVVEQGGPHVIFGWGNACVDDLVTAFLIDDRLPQRETSCPGVVSEPYLPLAPGDLSAFADPLAVLSAFDDEVTFLPEYYFWDLETASSVGCRYGGRLTFGPAAIGEVWELERCAIVPGFVMTGSALYDYIQGELTLTISISGLAEGQLVYTRLDGGARNASGTYAGGEIDLTR